MLKSAIKKFWPLIALIILSVLLSRGDIAQFAVQFYAMGVVAAVLIAAYFILHDADGKGLFPYLDLEALVKKAGENPIAAAIVYAAVIYLLTVVIQVSAIVKQ